MRAELRTDDYDELCVCHRLTDSAKWHIYYVTGGTRYVTTLRRQSSVIA